MSKFAYVTVLYGNNIYITGAIVLGYSLMKTKTQYDRVILVTPDVSVESREILKTFYTDIIQIDYVSVNPNIFSVKDTIYRDVFTKLYVLSLEQYDKILLLDLDMIVAKNIDHLFRLEAPAACIKHYYVPYGQKIPSDLICDGDKLVGSINAGLILLKPDLSEWNDIQTDIQTNKKMQTYKFPEQEYISLRYCKNWTSITFNYNFQFGLTRRVKKYRYKPENIYVIHYSSSYKPWSSLNPNHVETSDEKKFIEEHKKYYDMWHSVYARAKSKIKSNFEIKF